MAIPKFIRDDWPRKLAALVFATLIWYSVYRQIQEPETFRDLEVTIPQGSSLAITNRDQIPRVTITVRGSKRALDRVATQKIRISQTLPEDIKPGPFQIRLKPSNIDGIGGLQVTKIEPDNFTVIVDRLITETLPVRQIFDGEPPPGSSIKSQTSSPPMIRVTGPESIVKTLTEITTQSIRLEQFQESFTVAIPLAVYPQIALEPATVQVNVQYQRRNDSRYFSGLAIDVLNGRDSDLYVAEYATTDTPTVEANVNGPRASLDLLTESSLRPFIDISDRTTAGEAVLPVQVWIAGTDCEVVSSRPATVRVRLRRRTAGDVFAPGPMRSVPPMSPIPPATPTAAPATPAPALVPPTSNPELPLTPERP